MLQIETDTINICQILAPIFRFKICLDSDTQVRFSVRRDFTVKLTRVVLRLGAHTPRGVLGFPS